MGSSMSRRPRTIQDWIQHLHDRVRSLEAPRTYNLGHWVLTETRDQRVVLRHPDSGTVVELAAPPAPAGNEDG